MCLAIPGKIQSIENQYDGWVSIVDEAEAKKNYEYLEEIGEIEEELNIKDFLPDKENRL